MPKEPAYVHGTDPQEQGRLSALNDLINEASLREMGIRGGERILDVGSGLGQLARAMARAAGTGGYVLGVERSLVQLGEARMKAAAAKEDKLVELREGDAIKLPLRADEWGTFDIAHARFVLEHVADPVAVVRGMVKAVRRGGRIILADDDHEVLRLWPEPPGFEPLWRTYMRVYDRMGTDPIVGRRLVSLLHQAGAKPVRNAWPFFGCCAGSRDFPAYVENLVGVIRGARERIVADGLMEAKEFDDAIATVRRWKNRPDAAIWFAICWAEGVRPG